MIEVINSLRFDKMFSFRERFHTVDVLLVDDIQFIVGKERTQEEIFHTFNASYEQQKQIVISSDCLPKDINSIEERLRSRFEWGIDCRYSTSGPGNEDRDSAEEGGERSLRASG